MSLHILYKCITYNKMPVLFLVNLFSLEILLYLSSAGVPSFQQSQKPSCCCMSPVTSIRDGHHGVRPENTDPLLVLWTRCSETHVCGKDVNPYLGASTSPSRQKFSEL